jgi:hypothetical protein
MLGNEFVNRCHFCKQWSNSRGRLSTVYLLLLTGSNYPDEVVNCTDYWAFPWLGHSHRIYLLCQASNQGMWGIQDLYLKGFNKISRCPFKIVIGFIYIKRNSYNGATTLPMTTFSIATLSIATLSIATLSIATLSIATLSITTFSVMTLSITVNKTPQSAQRNSA